MKLSPNARERAAPHESSGGEVTSGFTRQTGAELLSIVAQMNSVEPSNSVKWTISLGSSAQ